jgi:phosphomannomutase
MAGRASRSIMAAIESYLDKPLAGLAATPAKIEEVDFNPEYIAAIAKFVDLEAIRKSGYKFLIDCMYGAGRGVIAGSLRGGIPFVEIRSEINPAFPGINPEPILPHIKATQ